MLVNFLGQVWCGLRTGHSYFASLVLSHFPTLASYFLEPQTICWCIYIIYMYDCALVCHFSIKVLACPICDLALIIDQSQKSALPHKQSATCTLYLWSRNCNLVSASASLREEQLHRSYKAQLRNSGNQACKLDSSKVQTGFQRHSS